MLTTGELCSDPTSSLPASPSQELSNQNVIIAHVVTKSPKVVCGSIAAEHEDGGVWLQLKNINRNYNDMSESRFCWLV